MEYFDALNVLSLSVVAGEGGCWEHVCCVFLRVKKLAVSHALCWKERACWRSQDSLLICCVLCAPGAAASIRGKGRSLPNARNDRRLLEVFGGLCLPAVPATSY